MRAHGLRTFAAASAPSHALARRVTCALCLSAAVSPTLRADYLFSDDYYWYDIQHARPADAVWEATMNTVMNGRPVHGALFIATLPLLKHPATWLALRALGVLLLGVVAWSFAWALRRHWPAHTADWIGTALAALPGCALFSFWLIAMPCLLAAAAGAVACELAQRPGVAARTCSALLLVAGLATYQPFALVYFALLGLAAALGRRVGPAFAWGVTAVAIYYALARLCIAAFGFDVATRGELVFAPLAKLRWFFASALPFSAKLWWVALPGSAALCLLLGLGVWVLWQSRSEPAAFARRAAGVLVCAAATVLPHLSVRETVTRFRTLMPLSVLLALLVLALVVQASGPLRRALVPGLSLCALISCATTLLSHGVLPERALVLAAARALERARVEQRVGHVSGVGEPAALGGEPSGEELAAGGAVYVVRARATDVACMSRLSDDEYGAPSSQHDFAIAGIVRLASELTRVAPPRVLQGLQPSAADGVRLDLRHIDPRLCSEVSGFRALVSPAQAATLAPTDALQQAD